MSGYSSLVSQFADRVPYLAEDEPFLPLAPELVIQSLWFAGALGRDFMMSDGTAVRIIQFGEWNRSAGPDFSHAVVEINGIPHHGDLELDHTATDWEAHGHSTNENFRNVVLHVVCHAPAHSEHFTRNNEHKLVPRIVLDRDKLAEALQKPRQASALAKTGRCCQPLSLLDTSALHSLLESAARHRAQWKATRFLRMADAHGTDQALFFSLAETLGYGGNSLPMRLLAQRAPLSALRKDPQAIEAILFGTAGFLHPELHEKAPADTREYLRILWDVWWKLRADFEICDRPNLPWSMGRQRPAHHPHRRLGTLAALAGQWSSFRKIALARPFSPQKTIESLAKLQHPFWSYRHTLTSKATATPLALFGNSLALELLANHLIPLALHEDCAFDFATYAKLPAATPNHQLRRAGIRLFGSEDAAKPWTKRLAWQQALLQIYRDFCLSDLSDCAHCPFPEQLAQWNAEQAIAP